jgi:hypothetical protein
VDITMHPADDGWANIPHDYVFAQTTTYGYSLSYYFQLYRNSFFDFNLGDRTGYWYQSETQDTGGWSRTWIPPHEEWFVTAPSVKVQLGYKYLFASFEYGVMFGSTIGNWICYGVALRI